MNAFSKNYVPVIKVDDMVKAAKISEARTKVRERDLASDDPATQRRTLCTTYPTRTGRKK